MTAPRPPRAALLADDVPWLPGDVFSAIYGPERLALLRREADLFPERVTSANLDRLLPALADTEVLFSCWGMPRLTPGQLARLPRLRAVFYASGSVASFAAPLLERGVLICSGHQANAIPVAEFCLAQILLSCKGAWRNTTACRLGPWRQGAMPSGPGVYGEIIALLGLGAVSRHLLGLLRPFRLRVILHDPAVSPAEASALGIDALADLDTCFRDALVVSNHFPDRPDNQRILHAAHFAAMRPGATFLNTGRGAQVDEPGLVQTLRARPDLTALLDVQHPEPPAPGSPLYTLPNVHLTSHIAGSMHDELHRMADHVIEDFLAWKHGRPLHHQVAPTLLAASA